MYKISSIWSYVHVFGLGLILPTFFSFMYLRRLESQPRAWIRIFLATSIGTLYFHIFARSPNLIVKFFSMKSDTEKIIFRLTLVPLISFVGWKITNWNAKKMVLHEKEDSFYFSLVYLLIVGLINRFIQNNLSSYVSTMILTFLLALLEIVLRTTLKYRNRWVEKYLLRKSDEKIREIDADQEMHDTLARVLLVEMMSEYVIILISPALTVFYQKNSIHFQLGYNIDGTYDWKLLSFSTCFSLIIEVLVDVYSFKKLQKYYKMTEAWESITGNKKIWFKMFPLVLVSTLTATFLVLSGFRQTFNRFSNDQCVFVNKCLPKPCR
jgi:hypothetical protein